MRILRTGFLVGLLFAFLLNVGHLSPFLHGTLTLEHLFNHGQEEIFYVGIIKEASEGYLHLGHVVFKEHRQDHAVASYAPVAEGWMIRFFHLPLVTGLFAGDVLFPLAAVFLLFLAGVSIFRSRFVAGCVALSAACYLGNYWLRSSNPQLPYVLMAGYLALYFSEAWTPRWRAALRAGVLGLLVYIQMLYASLFLLAEACDALRRWVLGREPLSRLLREYLIFGITFAVLLIPKLLTSLRDRGNPNVADLYHRLGLIPSRLPAAPLLQLQVACLFVLLLWLRRRRTEKAERRICDLLLTLLAASLVGLNQSIVHGVDATFGSYYGNVIIFFFWFIGAFTAASLLRRYPALVRGLAACLAAFSLTSFAFAMVAEERDNTARVRQFEQSGMGPVLAWLARQPGQLVVAAPRGLSGYVPVYTDHYALYAIYAYNQPVTDKELAERYLLEKGLFPADDNPDRNFHEVLGGYATMLAARQRTLCRMLSSVFGKRDCTVSPRPYTVHPDVLTLLEEGTTDVPAMLRKYHVDLIIDKTVPAAAPPWCTPLPMIGPYHVLRCT